LSYYVIIKFLSGVRSRLHEMWRSRVLMNVRRNIDVVLPAILFIFVLSMPW
jgi:hypothetical protein